MTQNAWFTVGQKAFIEKDGKILVLISEKYGIDFPGGRIKEGEMDFEKALKREVREETGLEVTVGNPFITWYFETQEGEKIFTVGYLCNSATNSVTISDEHDTYEWVDKDSYKALFKKVGKYDIDCEILEKLFAMKEK